MTQQTKPSWDLCVRIAKLIGATPQQVWDALMAPAATPVTA
jgi:DNA-binding XRE family transcriptional regulator